MTRSELQRAICQITHGTDVKYWESDFTISINRYDQMTIHFTNLTEETGAIPSTIGG
jgi:hypothetical protein